MEDIIKEIERTELGEIRMEDRKYFNEKTLIPREYLNNEVINNYSNLVFVRIFMKNFRFVWLHGESTCCKDYYFFSAFIDKNVLAYIKSEIPTFEFNGEIVINLINNNWNEQLKLRNRILKSCPIIMAECEKYYIENDFLKLDNLKLRDKITVYCPDYKIEDYELLDSTNFVLISNSHSLSQGDLNKFCLEVLSNFIQEKKKIIDDKKAIYLSISRKLKNNKTFTQQELIVLDEFISGEIEKADKTSDEEILLIKSKSRRIE